MCKRKVSRPDEEAVVDHGGTSSVLNIHYEKEELEGHRTLFVGVRMPMGRQSHRHHRPHSSKHRRRAERMRAGSVAQEDINTESTTTSHDLVLDHQEAAHELDDSVRMKVREALLKRHHHQSDKKRNNLLPMVKSLTDSGRRQSEPHHMDKAGPATSPQPLPTNPDMKIGAADNGQMDLSKVDTHFMKKIPTGAEASNVLVGELDFLERSIVAFVRLSPAVLLTGLTEVPIPTRFLFILLGPDGKAQQYHEIGRSMATIMTDEIFHDVAYKAKDRSDLLAGIDEFLDQVTVLPPGEWDPSIRIEPPKSVPSQEKRKMPGVPNGTVVPVEEEQHGEHHGPELQRTGRDYELSYLSLRTCIGLWTAFLCLILVATDASSLVCYITRFTEEAFAALICLIFIYEALEKLFHLGELYPINRHADLDKLTLAFLKLETESAAPGEQPRFLGIREQRMTGLGIFLLMGLSVFMTGALQFIPMPVLYGVFLYMGVSSLKGIQFFDRLKLFGMPAKHQPDFIYLRHVPLRKVHLFTLTQLTCLVLLWVIKTSPAAIVFPMMVLALVFIRKLLDFCFSKRELSYLDDLMPENKKKKLDDDSKKAERAFHGRINDRGFPEVSHEGHMSIEDLRNALQDETNVMQIMRDFKRLRRYYELKILDYLTKPIPNYPKPVELHISEVIHVTNYNGFNGIMQSEGFKAQGYDNEKFSWWSLKIDEESIKAAEERYLEKVLPNRSQEQKERHEKFLSQYTTSPAFDTDKSRYGTFRFTFSLKELMEAYKEQMCGGQDPVLREYKTVFYKQEIILYSIRQWFATDNSLFRRFCAAALHLYQPTGQSQKRLLGIQQQKGF
ncbi:electroneutral sodium bicarbonate exchanger 1-like isoform X1 [Labeo rohita]|uniref:Electroneutral sodium bicarbonate exchanger 1-like isoform X1 n=1 Tax=Labeo rohita TaxID=84645 RepID=A0A498L6P1_LABRO|nr:electroneutral sodium bicarbonate exchanger 1-like isoform X1 [Labeo rohita]